MRKRRSVTFLRGSVYMMWLISLVGTLRRYSLGKVSMEILEILYHLIFFFLISCYVFEAHLDAREGKEKTKVEAEENVEAVSLEATELTFKEMIIEGSEEDAEAESKEVTENFGEEGSLHMMPGIFLCQCFNTLLFGMLHMKIP